MGGMSASEWLEQQLILVDVDNDADEVLARKKKCDVSQLAEWEKTPIMSPDKALEICREKNLPIAFWYQTFSHSDTKPKFRLGFVMDRVITDMNERDITVNVLYSLFPQSDKSCRNRDKYFLGTDKGVFICDENARITMESILSIPIPPQPEKPAPAQNSDIETSDPELAELKRNFDFLGLLVERNGECHDCGSYVTFKNCEVCHCHDNLRFYKADNTFYCFSDKGAVGGSVIDYLIAADRLTRRGAIEKFKYELCGMERPYDEKVLQKLKRLNAGWNYSLDDKGISKMFSDVYKDNFRYNVDAKAWYYYTGKIWVMDKEGMNVNSHAKTFVNTLFAYANSVKNEPRKNALIKCISNLGRRRGREDFIKDARDNYPISNANLDTDMNAFNCINGTLNLETLELRKHSPKDLISKIANVAYDPAVKCPIFKGFMWEVMQGDKAKIRYLQKILGYALTADTNMETCFVLYGESTRNGKSTLVETISYMMGNTHGYALTMHPSTLAQKGKDSRQASGDIARLKGCRFLSVSEFPRSMVLDVAMLKQLTGRDTVTARHLFEREFEFTPCFKLFMNTNALPMVADETLFTSERINVIPFNRHFEPHEQDKQLKDKLKQPGELSGILNWCLRGLQGFIEKGATPPGAVRAATGQYQINSNKVSLFLAECLEPGNNVTMKEVYDVYQGWCRRNNYTAEGKMTFFGELKKRNLCTDRARVNGRTENNVICGRKIKDEFRVYIIVKGEKG